MSNLLKDLYNLSNKNSKAISFYNLALSSLNKKNYPNAVTYFFKALKEDSSNQMQMMVRPNLAQVYILTEQFEDGINELIKALPITTSNDALAYIHANLGFAYSQLKNYGFAIMEYKKALKYKNAASTHYSLAMLYEAKFQVNLVELELQKAIKLDPKNQVYQDALKNLNDTPAVSLKVGRTAHPLLNIGLIISPTYLIEKKDFYPMIIYVYPESPLKNMVKEGDFITSVDDERGIIEALTVEEKTRVSLSINNNRVAITAIPKITQKLDESEKIVLYRNWFKTFDKRIITIWETKSEEEKNVIGTNWGYEFESLIRSWSAYQRDPLFEQAFFLLMEFFQAFLQGDDKEVHYEINLAKLNINSANSLIVSFFNDIGFTETAMYLENKMKKELDSNANNKDKLAKKPIIRSLNKKGP